MYRPIFCLLFLLLTCNSAFAKGDIHGVLAPDEIPAGEQFTVIVAGNPVTKEQSRMIANQFPENWKIVRAYAAEDGATESSPIAQYSEMVSYFEKEKGRTIKVFEDRTRIYSNHFDGIAYFFVFYVPGVLSTANLHAVTIVSGPAGSTRSAKKKKKNAFVPVLSLSTVSFMFNYFFSVF